MAASKENKTTEITVDPTISKVDSYPSNSKSSSQQSFLAKWLGKKDSSNPSSNEPIEKSSCVSSHCAHNHHISDRSLEDQHSPRSTINKQQITNEPQRNVNALSVSSTVSVSSNEHDLTQEEQSGIPPRSPSNTKREETKSKIPKKISKTKRSKNDYSPSSPLIDKQVSLGNQMSIIRRFFAACFCCMFPKQNATIENSTQVTNDQENHEFFNSGVNHDSDQKLLVVSNHNDCDKNHIMSEETTSNIICVDTPLLDMIETKEAEEEEEEENKEVLCSMNIYEDLSSSNKQDDHHNEIMIEAQKQPYIIEVEANGSNKSNTIVPQHDQSDESKNSIFSALMDEQAKLKAYYDSFPNIDDAMDETGPDIKKAKEFTGSILSNLPSGDVNDRNTVCHALNKLFGNEHQGCLFYDSKNDVNLHDAFQNAADIDSHDRPFVLKLNSSGGLGNIERGKTEQDDLELVQTLTNVIEKNQSHPVIEDIIERLAKAHGVNKEDIVIKKVYFGTLNIVYTVKDLSGNNIKSLTELKRELKNKFEQFVSAKIHPLLYRPSFDIAYFDSRGNKSFPSESTQFEIGPPGRKKPYTTPSGWTRYGLKVLGNYPSDNWLHPFGDPGNWYRAFHGTGRAQSQDFNNNNQLFDMQYACVDALSSIHLNGFRKARVHAAGEGVYCSPNPKFPENGYVRPVPLDTQKGKKTFKCMLQVAVNPDSVKVVNNDVWVVPDPKDIRPYGILIKEA